MLTLVITVCFSSLVLAAETAPAPAKTAAAPATVAAPAKPATTPAPAEKPVPAVASADIPLPPGQITIGGLFGDKQAEGYADALIPVLMLKSGLLFIEPRGSLNDNEENECNFGVGYRQLFPDKNFIVGANAFYDYRETALDNNFSQVGFGLEFLSKWVDARANYYLPEDDTKVADRYVVSSSTVTESHAHSGAPTGDGNQIVQTSYVTDSTYDLQVQQHYKMYEQALEGFDCEVGALLPIPVVQDHMDVKAFVGYYNFDSDLSGRKDGLKARLEIRPMPSVYLDATYNDDDELFGSTYSVGARAVLPFDLAALGHGKSPFAGALDGFKLGKTTAPLSSRLTEMVIRDLHVRTEATQPEELIQDRVLKSKKLISRRNRDKHTDVIVDDVTFVDDDNRSGVENGSWEHPYSSIGEGVANPRSMVYVRDAAQQYYENVVLTEGIILWGSGCPIYGRGDRFLGGIYPVVNGGGNGPAITLASHTTVAGFEITQPEWVGTESGKPVSQSGIYGVNVTDVEIHCNYIHGSGSTGNGIEIRNAYMNSFEGSIWNNRILDVRGSGMDLSFYDVDNVDLALYGNTVTEADDDGIRVSAWGSGGYGTLNLMADDNVTSDNGSDGMNVYASDFGDANVQITRHTANDNYWDGISLTVEANGYASVLLENVNASGNYSGISLWNVSGDYGAETILADINVSGNYSSGIMAGLYGGYAAHSRYGDAFLGMFNVTANNNGGNGINFAQDHSSYSYSSYGGGYNGSDSLSYGSYSQYGHPAVLANNGNAMIYFANVDASGNNENGIFFGGDGAYADYGDATVYMYSVSANNNGASGIYVAQDYASGYYSYYSTYAASYPWGSYSATRDVDSSWSTESANSLARSRYGNASVYMDYVTATGNGYGDDQRKSKNNGYGIYIGGYGALSHYGNATFSLYGVNVNDNSASGLYIAKQDWDTRDSYNHSWVRSNNGDTASYGYGHYANYSGQGFGAGAYAVNGNALVTMQGVDASFNGAYGIFFGGYGAKSVNGTAAFHAQDVTADMNGDDGIRFAQLYSEYAMGHSDSYGYSYGYGSSSYGANYGVAFDMFAVRGGGIAVADDDNATAMFDNVSVSWNGGYGLFVGGYGAMAIAGSAYASLNDVDANYNGQSGIAFAPNGAYGTVDINRSSYDTETAYYGNSYNYSSYTSYAGGYAGGNAIAMAIHGNATAILSDISADGNGWGYYGPAGAKSFGYYGSSGYGIYIGGYGALARYGNASMMLSEVSADGNYNDGIHFAPARSMMEMDGSYSHHNDLNLNPYPGYYGSDVNGYYGNYRDAEYGQGMAFAYYGNAYASLYGVSASYNWDDGIQIAGYGARAIGRSDYGYGDGNATFMAEYMRVDGNDEGGFQVDGLYTYWSSYSRYTRSNYTPTYSASSSGYYSDWSEYGSPAALASAEYGNAYASMTYVSADWNYDDEGIYVGGYGAIARHGNAYFSMYGISASDNDGDGICFDATWSGGNSYENNSSWDYGPGYSHSASYYNDSNWNVDIGNALASATYGMATANLYGINADWNNGHGIYIGGYGAIARYGNASFSMGDVGVWDNDNDGIRFGMSRSGFWAYTSESSSSSSGGGATYSYFSSYANSSGYSSWGNAVAMAEYGNAYASFDGVYSGYNGGYGIFVGGYGALARDGNATFSMNDVDAYDNGADGIHFAQDYNDYSSYSHVYQYNNFSGWYYENSDEWQDSAAAYGNGVAVAYDGSANASFNNVYAEDNGWYGYVEKSFGGYNTGYGIYIGGYGAHAVNGYATFMMTDVSADWNERSGIYFAGAYGYSYGGTYSYVTGSGYQTLTDNYYDYDWMAPTAVARADNGGAYASFDNVSASANGWYTDGHGILIGGYGAIASDGDAWFSMNGVYADMNGNSGVAFVSGWNDKYNRNYHWDTGYGPYIDQSYSSYSWMPAAIARTDGGYATATLDDVSVWGNDGDGIYVDGYGAIVSDGYGSSYGYAGLYMSNIDADNNSYDGIYFENTGAYVENGYATVNITDTSASWNWDGDGICFDWGYAAWADNDGSASVTLTDVTASNNDGDGIYGAGALAYGSGQNAGLMISGVTANGNGNDGLNIDLYADEGVAGLLMQDSVITGNGDEGVSLDAETWVGSTMLILGIEGFIGGDNSIYGNGSYDLANWGEGDVKAENNWWGTTSPQWWQFAGSIDIDPWLSSDPNAP